MFSAVLSSFFGVANRARARNESQVCRDPVTSMCTGTKILHPHIHHESQAIHSEHSFGKKQ